MNFKKCSMQSDLLPAKQHTLVTAQAGETTLGKNLASDWRMRGEVEACHQHFLSHPSDISVLGLLLKFIRVQL